jgi:hypothetical protein
LAPFNYDLYGIRWTFHLLIHAFKCVKHNPYDSYILYIIVEVCTSLLTFFSLNDLFINIPSFIWIRLMLNQSIYRAMWSVFCLRTNSIYINMRNNFFVLKGLRQQSSSICWDNFYIWLWLIYRACSLIYVVLVH